MASLPGSPRNCVNVPNDPLLFPVYFFPWLDEHGYHVGRVCKGVGATPYKVRLEPGSGVFHDDKGSMGTCYYGQGLTFEDAVYAAIRDMKEELDIE